MSSTEKPDFNLMKSMYQNGTADAVFQLIGGKVEANNFANSCAIRVSRSLNYSGHPIKHIPPNLTVSGSDGKWYIYRVKELIKYLEANFEDPDISAVNKPYKD